MFQLLSHPESSLTVTHPMYKLDWIADYFSLLKPRVMSLVIFTALCGLLMAPGSLSVFSALMAIVCIAFGAGAAGVLNMWYDRDIDGLMMRTQSRALPSGRIPPENALIVGVFLGTGSIGLMAITVHLLAAVLLAFTILFYTVVYTVWLKRSTSQNIVIGGVAGALPPVIGWVAVTHTLSLEAWSLFLIIFLWTPPHFWALCLTQQEDYRRAHVPMLPLVAGELQTKRHIIYYTLLLLISSYLPYYPLRMVGLFYVITAVILDILFIVLSGLLFYNQEKAALRLFGYSIIYLFLIFFVMTVDRCFL